ATKFSFRRPPQSLAQCVGKFSGPPHRCIRRRLSRNRQARQEKSSRTSRRSLAKKLERTRSISGYSRKRRIKNSHAFVPSMTIRYVAIPGTFLHSTSAQHGSHRQVGYWTMRLP